jgi:Bacterial Ig-like domain (group 3)/MBG domain (YGX type)
MRRHSELRGNARGWLCICATSFQVSGPITQSTTPTCSLGSDAVTLSGVVQNGQGAAIPGTGNGTTITLQGGPSGSITEDIASDGSFLFTVLPGTYTLKLSLQGVPGLPFIVRPQTTIDLTSNTVQNLTIPYFAMSTTATDSLGAPVANVAVAQSTECSALGFSLFSGATTTGYFYDSYYVYDTGGTTTGSDGVAAVPMLPCADSQGFEATPATGSGYAAAPFTVNGPITESTTASVTLYSIYGDLTDSGGNALDNQTVALNSAGASTTTDATGFYGLTAPPGTYSLTVSGGSGTGAAVPSSYSLTVPSVDLTNGAPQTNLTLPVVTQKMIVSDGVTGLALPGAPISISCGPSTVHMFTGGTASGSVCGAGTTDASGDAGIAELATSGVTITINPPPGTGYCPVTLTNQTIPSIQPDTVHMFLGCADSTTSSLSSSSTNNASTYGQSVTLTVIASGNGTPTGTIAFMEGATNLKTATLSSGQATYTTTALKAGAHSLSAVYTPTTGTAYVTSTSATLTQTVNPAPLTVTAGSPTATYGQGDVTVSYWTPSSPLCQQGPPNPYCKPRVVEPIVTCGYVGLQNRDTAPAIAATGMTSALAGSLAGTYGTTCWGAYDPNYTFSYSGGSLTVSPAPLTIHASNSTVAYGAHLSQLSWKADFVNHDTASSLSRRPSCSAGVRTNRQGVVLSLAGKYRIRCARAKDSNYRIRYASGILRVELASTKLTYDGPISVTRTTHVRLTANLTSSTGSPIAGRAIEFSLGKGSAKQRCSGLTNRLGMAGCTIRRSTDSSGPRLVTIIFRGDARGGNHDYGRAKTIGIVWVY